MNKDVKDYVKIFMSFIITLFTMIIPMLFVKYHNTLGKAEISLNVLFLLDTYFVYELVKYWINSEFKRIEDEKEK
jgi:hypothetical protein